MRGGPSRRLRRDLDGVDQRAEFCQWRRVASARTGSPLSPAGVSMAGIDRPGSKGGDRDKALETALAQIERQFGRGSVMRLRDEVRAPIEVIPTGAIFPDLRVGIGGFPPRPGRRDIWT